MTNDNYLEMKNIFFNCIISEYMKCGIEFFVEIKVFFLFQMIAYGLLLWNHQKLPCDQTFPG